MKRKQACQTKSRFIGVRYTIDRKLLNAGMSDEKNTGNFAGVFSLKRMNMVISKIFMEEFTNKCRSISYIICEFSHHCLTNQELMNEMVKMLGVTKVFPNGAVALSNITLNIDKGEFVFIVGPSGAGKSTIIKLISREELPTKGYLVVGGRDLSRLRRREVPFYRRKLGVVFQDFRLLPNKTVYENIAFAMEVVEAPPRIIKKRIPEVLQLVGLKHKMWAMPSELSGGEQQRVSLARAIVNNPELIIADEPTGNLDPETSWEIFRLLNEINRSGTTVIVATHASNFVNKMRKRVISIDRGMIIRDQEKGVYGYEI
jgi:cell division transport system ATP-binding protein